MNAPDCKFQFLHFQPQTKNETDASSRSKEPATKPVTLANGLTAYVPCQAPSQLADQDGMKICRFCHLEVKSLGFEAHEEYCGSRTEQCPECSDYVMLKDWEKHQAMRLYHGKYCLSLTLVHRLYPVFINYYIKRQEENYPGLPESLIYILKNSNGCDISSTLQKCGKTQFVYH